MIRILLSGKNAPAANQQSTLGRSEGSEGVGRVIGRVLAGDDLCHGAQGRHGRRPRLRAINHGPSTNGSGENCGRRGLFTRNLAPPGSEGTTFEGPDGAGFPWELIGLPSG